jgi:hypothetical protein
MFRRYWYTSGINETMRAELADVVVDGVKRLGGLSADDVVVDVGANDGTLLANYPGSLFRVAYEPALNLGEQLAPHCDVLHTDYFPGTARFREPFQGRVKLLTSIACFYATSDPVGFVRAVDELLALDGLWVVQFQDLHQMLQANAFDDICAEHVFYPCLASMERLLVPYNLYVIDAQWRTINGGSMRLIIGRQHRLPSSRVSEIRSQERRCESPRVLDEFAQRAYKVRDELRDVLERARAEGKVVDIYGASTKGNTLLQFCDLGPDVIRRAWERSESKWGRRTATGIPIVSESEGRQHPPDILLALIWQFRESILERERGYLENGGAFLFPLPTVELVRA